MEVPGKHESKARNKSAKMLCEPCDGNDETSIAENYCVDCNEFLCEGCAKVHRKSKMSRNHELLEGDNMPTAKFILSDDNTCSLHDGKPLEYFCNTHTGFCCTSCVTLEHRSCNLDYLTEKADGFEDGEEYSALTDKIQKVRQRISGTKDKIQVYQDRVRSNHLNFLEEVQEFRNNIETIIEAVVDNATERANVTKSRDVEELNSFTARSDELAEEIDKMVEELDQLSACKQKTRLCIAAKQVATKIDTIEINLVDIETKSRVRRYNFRGSEIMNENIKSWNNLELLEFADEEVSSDEVKNDESKAGSFDDQKEASCDTTESVASGLTDIALEGATSVGFGQVARGKTDRRDHKTADFDNSSSAHANQTNKVMLLKKIYIRHKRDTDASGCLITSMIELTSHRFLLSDYNNFCLKIVDVVYHTIVSYVKLACRPWDITLTANNSLVASCCDRLIFFRVADLTKTKEVDVNGRCSGVACQGNNLLLMFISPKPCLKVLNMEGIVLRTIPDNPWIHICASPNFVLLCSSGKEVLISDDLHGLLTVTMTASTNSYKEKILQSPFGITQGRTGTIFVAGRDSNNVAEISEPLKKQGQTKMRVIVSEIETPLALVYIRATQRLYVSHDHVVSDTNDYLSVFQL